MKQDVFISITGTQTVNGEPESIELMTYGRLYKKNKDYFITYTESEDSGFVRHRTTLHVENHRVTMRRTGASSSHLVIEKGCRHQCHYDTGFGSITVGICGAFIRSTLSDAGGEVDFSYSMDIDAALASENRVVIHVRPDNRGYVAKGS